MKNEILEFAEFDFAFSFAGEDRDIVEKIYHRLTADGVRVFYDYAYQAQLVGKDLFHGLRMLYKNKGTYVVCFISEHYARKMWTNLEFTAIKERLMSTFFASDFLIPVLIGGAKPLEDIPSFLGFYTYRSVDETVEMLKEKLRTTIAESNLISNVNNCISYICPQIRDRLQSRNIKATLVANKLVIARQNDTLTFGFSSDTIAQTPCILIIKAIGAGDTESLSMDEFPSYIITWKKQDGLYFAIHGFEGNKHNDAKEQPLNSMINHICSCIEAEVGG